MIKSIQSSENIVSQPLKNFKGASKKGEAKNITKDSRLQAAEIKYNLACLWAATTQLENVKLKQELANAMAETNYGKACCQ